MGRNAGVRRALGLLLSGAGVALASAAPVAGSTAQDTVAAHAADGGAALSGSTWAREARIAPVTPAIAVDGALDDPGWAGALTIDLPFEVAPAENVSAPVATRCRLAYDRDHLYLGCLAEDPTPGDIRAFVADRDGIDTHDRVVLTLDPFNDQRRAFQFGVSALGVQSDAVLSQQGGGFNGGGGGGMPDLSWDAIWRSAGRVTPEGYVVEAAVPFRSLRFPRSDGPATWGVYVTRWWPRSADTELRSLPLDRDNSCVLCQSHRITGFAGVTPGTNVQLTPTLTTSRSDTRPDFPAGALRAGPRQDELGVDAQWGVTSDLTVNLTINPDFSQVEADVAQLEVNNRFALFFPEKRPFFLEGADFFATPVSAVFTRSVSDPVAGAKITGKLGANALGLLVARDAVGGLLLPGPQRSRTAELAGPVTTAAARFRRDVGASSTVGTLWTDRRGDGYHNRVAAADVFVRPVAPLTLQLQVLRSDTEYPHALAAELDQPRGAFTGDAVAFSGRWAGRDWLVNTGGRRMTPGFRADAGFVTQAGFQGGNVNVIRRFWGDGSSWFTQIRTQIGVWHNRDFEGNQLNGGMWMGLMYEGPRQSGFSLFPNLFMKERFAGVTYDGLHQVWFDGRIRPTGALSVAVDGQVGDGIDVANAALGHELRIAPGVEARLGRHLELSLRHTYQRLDRAGGRVFTANLTQLRAVYAFSPRSFVRSIVQRRRTDRDPALHRERVDVRTRAVFTQLLYAYKVNPQTLLFLGYSDDRDGAIEPEGRRIPLTQRGRTFFLKLGYAWRP